MSKTPIEDKRKPEIMLFVIDPGEGKEVVARSKEGEIVLPWAEAENVTFGDPESCFAASSFEIIVRDKKKAG